MVAFRWPRMRVQGQMPIEGERQMSRTLWIRIGVGLIVLAGVAASYQFIAVRVQPLPVYMALPEAILTDQDGQAFDLNQTRGKVVVLSLIYIHCPDICPLTTAKMKQIQDRVHLAGLDKQVQLVTFTVDPARDSPEVLKRFAGVFHADPSNWVFLTGTPDQIDILIKGLSLYVERVYYIDNTPVPASALSNPAADTPYLVNHTDRLFLIDRQGNVRAIPPGSRADVAETMQLIQQIVQDRSGGQ
jgi:protein SCO1/2